jgi:hypothetical protein
MYLLYMAQQAGPLLSRRELTASPFHFGNFFTTLVQRASRTAGVLRIPHLFHGISTLFSFRNCMFFARIILCTST